MRGDGAPLEASVHRVAEMLCILATVPVGVAQREVLLLLDVLIEASTSPGQIRRAVRDAVEPILTRRFGTSAR